MSKYKRVLLKLSGEALKGTSKEDILEKETLAKLASIIKDLVNEGVELGIVVGGGNIFRGRIASDFNLERKNADYMGMVATIINALVVENILNVSGVKAKALSPLPINTIIEEYKQEVANKYLSEGYVVIYGGGRGLPFFTTDTTAALRANETGCEIILAGKHGADGVYSDDPNKNENAVKYETVSFDEFLDKKLQAMDLDAIRICKENNISIRVFNMDDLDNIKKVVDGEPIGSLIRKD